MAKTNASDRSIWKMNSEQLQEHLKLQRRARRIPDKKKQLNKKACRGKRQAFGLIDVGKARAEKSAQRRLRSYAFGYEHTFHWAGGGATQRQTNR